MWGEGTQRERVSQPRSCGVGRFWLGCGGLQEQQEASAALVLAELSVLGLINLALPLHLHIYLLYIDLCFS